MRLSYYFIISTLKYNNTDATYFQGVDDGEEAVLASQPLVLARSVAA
jgi:hypothetical protein